MLSYDEIKSLVVDNDRNGLTVESFQRSVLQNLCYEQLTSPNLAGPRDWYAALALSVRDRILGYWIDTVQRFNVRGGKFVAYLSAEFLLGPHLGNNLLNLGITETVREAVTRLGLNLEEILEQEEEPGLGNGGLGRLAACYMDSLATLEVPAIGYGIRYEFGIFDQVISNGWQVEEADHWLRYGNPWEIVRPANAQGVKFGGRTERYTDQQGRKRVLWIPERVVVGVPYDTPILGYQVNNVARLRLWKAEAHESFDFEAFNKGDYYSAVEDKLFSENITKVLYPNDEPSQGKQLRLEQQYFFVSCSLQDMIRLQIARGEPIEKFHLNWAAQLNDTHPSIAVAELMRLLIDEHFIDWDRAWEITRNTFAYTNHTLLPEALERWPLPLFERLLPRLLEIIYEINDRFLTEVRERLGVEDGIVSRLSLIDESGERYIRMAHLATVGSHAVNGVAELHSELLKRDVLKDFYNLSPAKFLNITNGVTPRRWVALSNPQLTKLISQRIGDEWLIHPKEELPRLEEFVDDAEFQQEWCAAKLANKQRLTKIIQLRTGITVDPASMFDIQVKRLHEYKRQHLNVLHIISMYKRLKRNTGLACPKRTFIFGGKAAPGYFMAKLIIKLIHSVGEVVNNDPAINDCLKVVFLPDYNVTNSQPVYPAADLSEQISTAGKEASGTGNMKFAMNGAVTIGTLDGANVEIMQAVGAENFFLFGLNADEVFRNKCAGYRPWEIYQTNPELKETIDSLTSGEFSEGDRQLFEPLAHSLLSRDEYMLFADFQAYADCQQKVSKCFADQTHWTRMSILNAARVGTFSSDRAVRQYCAEVWGVKPVR